MSIFLAVTDTHALIWYARQRWSRLGRKARQVYQDAEAGRAAIYVPTVVLVEVFEAAHRGDLDLDGGCQAWAQGLWSTGRFIPVGLSAEVVYRAEALYSIPERQDRLIAATAVHLDLPLLTRDQEISAPGLVIVWN